MSSILKAELKQLVTNEVGVRVEDALEAAKKEGSVLEGRQTAFLDGSKAVEALLKVVDEDLTAGRYPLETATEIKRFLQRGSQALQNLSQQANNYRIAQAGKIQGFEHTVKLLSSIVEAEKQKIAQIQAQAQTLVASGVTADTAAIGVGVPPRPLTIKERRLAEEAAEPPAAAESAAAVAPVEPPPPVVALPTPPPVVEVPAKRRRGRPRRANNS